MQQITNYMEVLVKKYLEDVLSEWQGICTCEKCKRDMMALALNQLKPMYVATQQGEVYAKANITFNPQCATDVVLALNEAIKIVSQEVRHG